MLVQCVTASAEQKALTTKAQTAATGRNPRQVNRNSRSSTIADELWLWGMARQTATLEGKVSEILPRVTPSDMS